MKFWLILLHVRSYSLFPCNCRNLSNESPGVGIRIQLFHVTVKTDIRRKGGEAMEKRASRNPMNASRSRSSNLGLPFSRENLPDPREATVPVTSMGGSTFCQAENQRIQPALQSRPTLRRSRPANTRPARRPPHECGRSAPPSRRWPSREGAAPIPSRANAKLVAGAAPSR
jgi:hypothetical protein